MRIHRPWLPAGVPRYEATCPECRCDFEFVGAEARRVPKQGGGFSYRMRCPFCGAAVTKDAD